MILEKVNYPDDLKELNIKEKKQLAEELRERILEVVSKNGGHLASNLGVVELTIALYSVLNLPKDKVIWDVGHQSYVHKLLTGRKDKFNTLRKMDGLAGFTRVDESIYDAFDTGHSSTSISAALGMARARDILGTNEKVVAIIGDGALTGGMAMEALNDAGISKTNLIVVLNDNGMSISPNTGGMSRFLSGLRTQKGYIDSNNKIRNLVIKIPIVGKGIYKGVTRIKNGIKSLFISNMYFESIGFKYLGPVNGHSIEDLEKIFKRAMNIEGPILIHVITKKGKGYKLAEDNPNKYHGVSSFDLNKGVEVKNKNDYSKVMGEELLKIAKKDKRIVAITAAMEEGTGLVEFCNKYPNRFFDVEIAEQHALTMAAGMAAAGLKPVIPIYSSFLQRGYDQLVHDIALQKLPVVICVDRAGVVGNDGETHQGLLDLSFLNTIPNMNVMAPKDFEELRMMLDFALTVGKPIAIRYPRGGESNYKFNKHNNITYGKGELLRKGDNITIVAIGKMVAYAMGVAELLEKDNIYAEVINARFAKPFDKSMIRKSIKKTNFLVTIEDNNVHGGFGETLDSELDYTCKTINFGYPDEFIKHGSVDEIEKKYGLDVNSIYERIKKEYNSVK